MTGELTYLRVAEPDRLVAIATGLGEVSAHAARKDGAGAASRFLRALAHVTRDSREYALAGVATWRDFGGTTEVLFRGAEDASRDRKVADLLKHLRTSLLSPRSGP